MSLKGGFKTDHVRASTGFEPGSIRQCSERGCVREFAVGYGHPASPNARCGDPECPYSIRAAAPAREAEREQAATVAIDEALGRLRDELVGRRGAGALRAADERFETRLRALRDFQVDHEADSQWLRGALIQMAADLVAHAAAIEVTRKEQRQTEEAAAA